MARINIYAGPVIVDLRYRKMLSEREVLRSHHLADWRAGGLDAIVIPTSALSDVYTFLGEISRSQGELAYLKDSRDFLGKGDAFGIFISAEETILESDLDRLYLLAELGIPTFTFSHNRQNPYCTGCGERYEGGFTHLGISALKILETLPLLVDLVHTSRASFWQALDNYSRTVIVSHSNADAVCPHPRNLTDDQIRAVAERGGLIGINFYRSYVSKDSETATLDNLIDHVAHMADLVGMNHVAIGCDFLEAPAELVAPGLKHVDPTGAHKVNIETYVNGPEGIENITKLDNFVGRLGERGFTEEEIDQLLGATYLRVIDGRLQA